MLSADNTALIGAFIAIIIAILTPYLTGRENRRQDREKERHDYIDRTVTRLIDLRGQLQYLQIALHELISILNDPNLPDAERSGLMADKMREPEYQKMEMAFGQAFAIMLSVDIAEIRDKATQVMSPLSSPDAKLQAINFALERLGKEYTFFKQGKESGQR